MEAAFSFFNFQDPQTVQIFFGDRRLPAGRDSLNDQIGYNQRIIRRTKTLLTGNGWNKFLFYIQPFICHNIISPAIDSLHRNSMEKYFLIPVPVPGKKNYRDADKQRGNSDKRKFISNCHWDSASEAGRTDEDNPMLPPDRVNFFRWLQIRRRRHWLHWVSH